MTSPRLRLASHTLQSTPDAFRFVLVALVALTIEHSDGQRFRNLGPFERRGLADLRRWKTSGRPAASWPDFVDVPPARTGRGLTAHDFVALDNGGALDVVYPASPVTRASAESLQMSVLRSSP